MQTRVAVRYGICVGDADPYALVADAFVPLQVAAADGRSVPDEGQALSIVGAEVSAVVRREADGPLGVRVFNPSPETRTVTIEGRRGWLVDLRGRPLAQFEETFELGPWQVTTALLA